VKVCNSLKESYSPPVEGWRKAPGWLPTMEFLPSRGLCFETTLRGTGDLSPSSTRPPRPCGHPSRGGEFL